VIGVFLVFATLILPALAAHGLAGRRGLAVAYAVAAAGYALGLWLSVPLDLPAGPLIVCVLAALALCVAAARRILKPA
jgi:zinc/manganese transport system permease protein